MELEITQEQKDKETIEALETQIKWFENRFGSYRGGFKNWKNLFKKPTLSDWLVLIMLVALLAMSYIYIEETKQCRLVFKNLENNACYICNQFLKPNNAPLPNEPFFNVTFNGVDNTSLGSG